MQEQKLSITETANRDSTNPYLKTIYTLRKKFKKTKKASKERIKLIRLQAEKDMIKKISKTKEENKAQLLEQHSAEKELKEAKEKTSILRKKAKKAQKEKERIANIEPKAAIKKAEITAKIKRIRENFLKSIKSSFAYLKGSNRINISYNNFLANFFSSLATSNYTHKKSLKTNILIRFINWGTKWFFFLINDKILAHYINISTGIRKKTIMFVSSVLEGLGVYTYRNYFANKVLTEPIDNNIDLNYLNSISFAMAVITSTNSCEEQLLDFKNGGIRAATVGLLVPEVAGVFFHYLGKNVMSCLEKIGDSQQLQNRLSSNIIENTNLKSELKNAK